MEFSTQLLQKKEQLIEKSKDKPHEALYYKMLEATIEELISLGAHVEKLKENLFTKSSFKAYQSEWEEMMEEIGEALDLLIEMPYKVVKAKKIYEDYKSPGVLARDVSRSNMFIILLGLLRDEAITMDDLDEFSDELKEDIKQCIK